MEPESRTLQGGVPNLKGVRGLSAPALAPSVVGLDFWILVRSEQSGSALPAPRGPAGFWILAASEQSSPALPGPRALAGRRPGACQIQVGANTGVWPNRRSSRIPNAHDHPDVRYA